MPRGDKSKYTDKQERKADHIAEGYEKRGVSEKEAERRAWATVNKDDGGGKSRAVRAGVPAPGIGGAQGRTGRRQSCRFEARGSPLSVSEESGGNAKTPRTFRPWIPNDLSHHSPNKSRKCPAARRP